MRTCTKGAYEGDIVSRLRNWRGLHLAHWGRMFEEAADAIEELRKEVAALREERGVEFNTERPRPDEAW